MSAFPMKYPLGRRSSRIGTLRALGSAAMRLAAAAAMAFVLAQPAHAQRRGGGGFGSAFGCANPPMRNIPYDGRFTFVRLTFTRRAP